MLRVNDAVHGFWSAGWTSKGCLGSRTKNIFLPTETGFRGGTALPGGVQNGCG
jgi:hypothetical protein